MHPDRSAIDPAGQALFSLVEEYGARPHHRTGTAEDAWTLDWFASKARDAGARVERWPWTFARYVAEWSVAIDGVEVEAIPLWYSGCGEIAASPPASAVIDLAHPPDRLQEALTHQRAAARAGGATALAVATRHPLGLLFTFNRAPQPCESLATLFVASRHADALAAGQTTLRLSARVVDGASANVIAYFGEGARPLVIGTPLSGWFSCAGERGTGIALALALAQEAAARCPVILVGTSGHELDDLGLRLWLNSATLDARAVLHLGASIAAGDADGASPPRTFAQQRMAIASLPDKITEHLAAALAPLEVAFRHLSSDEAQQRESWRGEAREWARLGVPMLSLAGGSPLFHTPADTPVLATTPALLARAYAALRACLPILIAC